MKLGIELVPKSAWFKNLRSFLSQAEWDVVRRKCYRQANYVCEICGGKGPKHPVEAHEEWDYKNNEVILTGVVALCPSCHECKHIGLAQINGNAERAISHFMEVNEMDRAEAIRTIEAAFTLWHKRNKQQWSLNVEYLKQYLKEK